MFLVDTNILVYAANQAVPEHAVCRKLVEKWRNQSPPWYLTWKIIYEFLRVTTHPRVMPRPWDYHRLGGLSRPSFLLPL